MKTLLMHVKRVYESNLQFTLEGMQSRLTGGMWAHAALLTSEMPSQESGIEGIVTDFITGKWSKNS